MPQQSVTTMLQWPWAIAIVLGTAVLLAAATWLIFWRRDSRAQKARKDTLWVANSSYVTSLPSFKRRVRAYRATQLVGVITLFLAILATSFLIARPAKVVSVDPRTANRDIVLCLDISGSMIEYDQELVEIFAELSENFSGERIALTVFNSTSRIVFPLTDDYSLVREELEIAHDALDPNVLFTSSEKVLDRYLKFTAGANGEVDGSSLIGDGLANCALQFEDQSYLDPDSPQRSKSIIFATDNALEGVPAYSLQEAADLATELDVSLIGLYGAGNATDEQEQEYEQIFTDSGGLYFYSGDPSAVDAIVEDILASQAVDVDAAPIITKTDEVGAWFIWILVGLGAYLVVQRSLGE